MTLKPGTRLGPYEVVAPLGAGGMGEVYRARDSRLSRDVAIKVLPERLSHDTPSLARFERESKAVAALSHPNILVLFDVGTHDGLTYTVTELLEGQTLRERLDVSAISWRKAVEMGVAVAEGLSAAHSKGIVHRDLKPANIFLTSDGRVKILDFGLARWKPSVSAEEETVTFAATQTDAGTILGTLGYMSPEQVRGGTADARSDIFSLGCVLYEMLTGRRAFRGSSAGDIMAAILKEEPAPLTESGKQIPAELDRIIGRCLAKNAGERFHSAHDLAFALKSTLTASTERQADAPARPASLRRITILAMVLLVVLAGAFYYWQNRSGASIDSLAVLPFVNVGADPNTEYLSDGITESLIDSLSQVPNLKVMSRNSAFRYKGKDTDARTAGREMGVRAVLTGRITQRGDNLSVSTELVNVDDNSALWGEQYNRKLADVLAVQQEIAQQISDKLKLRLSSEQKTQLAKHQTANPEAYQLYLKGHYYASQFTAEGLEKGFDYLRQAIAIDPNYAQAYDGLAYAYQIQEGVFLSPLEVMPKAKEAARKALELDETLAGAHVEMATVHFWFEYDWAAAEREFQRALQLNPNYAPAHEFRGWALISLGRTDEALAESRRAVELDPLFYENISILGWNLYFARRYDQAVTELRKCIDLRPDYWACHFYLAQTYQQQGRFPDAVVELTKARELNGQSAVPPAELAHAYAMSGQTAKARQSLNDVLALAKSKYVDPYALGVVYAALGDKDEAFARLGQAYAERSFNMVDLKVDPELDSLRSDQRFQDLLRRMNFPQ